MSIDLLHKSLINNNVHPPDLCEMVDKNGTGFAGTLIKVSSSRYKYKAFTQCLYCLKFYNPLVDF